MKCPICLATMECRSAVKDKTYMDLHCFNQDCTSREINYRPHVEVVLSLAPAPWRCISYHLPFKEKGYGRESDTWYILEGKKDETTLSERSIYAETEKLIFDDPLLNTRGFITMKDNVVGPEMDIVVSVDKFLRISTGEKMHEDAKNVYEVMKKTEIWTDWSHDYNESSYIKHFGYGEYD